jgi:hypothetical protein
MTKDGNKNFKFYLQLTTQRLHTEQRNEKNREKSLIEN